MTQSAQTRDTAPTRGNAFDGDRPGLASGLLVGSLFLLGFQDALVKLLSADISLWQFQFLRACFNLTLVLMLARVLWGGLPPRPDRIWAVALRSLCLVTAMILFFSGVPVLGLADIAAGLYVFPLFVAVLSALFLGETVGPRRIGAVVAGFCGTLLILKPGTDAFQWAALLPVAAGFCYALTILVTRMLCRREHPATLALGVSLTFISAGAFGMLVAPAAPEALQTQWPYLFTGWRGAELWVVGVIAVCSAINLTSNIGLAKAYQSAESSWLAPFDYTYLIFATLWGYVIFHDVPDLLSFCGMALIAASGCYVAWRSRTTG